MACILLNSDFFPHIFDCKIFRISMNTHKTGKKKNVVLPKKK